MEQGWVKLHRQILDNIFLMKDDNAYMVFTKLLMFVNKKTGQYAAGRNQLGELLNMNPRTLYGVLIRLEREGILNIKANNRYSIITICNWGIYQSSSTSNATTTQQPRNNHATTTQHSNKKENIERELRNNIYVDSASPNPRSSDHKLLFSKLVQELGFSDQVKATPGRMAKLKSRLKTYTPEDLEKVASTIRSDAYMQGDNPGGVRYGTIDYLLRSDEKVDEWLHRRGNKLKVVKADW